MIASVRRTFSRTCSPSWHNDRRAIDPARPFSTWLYSVANNMCKNEYRREEVRKKAAPELRYEANGTVQSTAGDGLDRAHFSERLDAELDLLAHDHKATFVMRYHEDMAIKEIAVAFGCSEGTVKSRLFYTLKSWPNA